MTTLTLYFRSYCSLCEEMWRALEMQRARLGFELVVVDVDSDPVLEQSYGALVPVVCGPDGKELFHYFIDTNTLDAYFAAR
ncbi:MAG TPA: glutaredoxin family protein [Gammaproteobacteria bacterium]